MSLAQLWQLQQLELDREKEQKQLDRQLIKALTKEKEALLARQEELKREKAEWEKTVKQSKRLRQEIAAIEAKKQALEQELYGGRVVNPKELGHLEDQWQNVEAKLNTLLEDYLNLEEKVATMENCLQVKHDQLVKDMDSYNQKARQVKEKWQEGKVRLQTLISHMEELEAQIAPSLLQQYRRLQEQLGTVALAKVQGGNCGGCGIQLPSMFRQQLKQGKLIKCENCGRLLVNS